MAIPERDVKDQRLSRDGKRRERITNLARRRRRTPPQLLQTAGALANSVSISLMTSWAKQGEVREGLKGGSMHFFRVAAFPGQAESRAATRRGAPSVPLQGHVSS
jgi:hypothetical protein